MPAQQIVLREYVDAVKHVQGRVKAMEEEMRQAMEEWSLMGGYKAPFSQGSA
jgi:hypothetical protein